MFFRVGWSRKVPAGGIHTHITGVTFENRQDAIRKMPDPPFEVVLRPARENQHQACAVEIHHSGQQVGFVPKEIAARVWKPLIIGKTQVKALVTDVVGTNSGGFSYGLRVYVYRADGASL